MNIYNPTKTISELSHKNKYLKWYLNIINNSKTREISQQEIYEHHHIVPECFFINRKRKGRKGFLEGNPDQIDNIAILTIKEHIFVHIFLYKMMKRTDCKQKMLLSSIYSLSTKPGNISIKTATFLREEFSKNHPAKLKSQSELSLIQLKVSDKKSNTWKNRTEEQKKSHTKKVSENWFNRTEEEKSEINKKRNDTRKNNTPEQKEKTKLKYEESWKNRTQEEKIKSKELSRQNSLEKYGVSNYRLIEKVCIHCKENRNIAHELNCPKNPNRPQNKRTSKTFKITDPNGQDYIVTGGLSKFCDSKKITVKSLKSGMGRAKGWKIEEIIN